MSRNGLPVDFGVLPYSSSTSERNSSGSSNSRASILNSLPPHQRLGLQLAEGFAIKMEWTGVQWNSGRTTVLDYQCGSGMISQILTPYVKYIIGIDPSNANVDEYNRKAHSQGLYATKLHGYTGDFCSQHTDLRFETPEFFEFDVVIVGPGFHQCSQPQLVLLHLIRRLRIGGTLLVMDYVSPYNGYASIPNQYRLQYGFLRSELHNLVEQQGLVEIGVELLTDSQGTPVTESTGNRQVVFAKGVKPPPRRWQA